MNLDECKARFDSGPWPNQRRIPVGAPLNPPMKGVHSTLPPRKPRVKIENWQVIPSPRGGYVLLGDVIDHPELGSIYIRTSLLVRIDFARSEAETLNTIYELGEPLEPRVLS